jgi:hypothetical protein
MVKNMLDWCLGGASATQPPGFWLQWATGSPNDAGASDGPCSPRVTVSFAAAASPAGTKSNAGALTGTATAMATAQGWNIYDRSVGGTRLFYGTLSAKVGNKSADNPAFAVGALVVTLV